MKAHEIKTTLNFNYLQKTKKKKSRLKQDFFKIVEALVGRGFSNKEEHRLHLEHFLRFQNNSCRSNDCDKCFPIKIIKIHCKCITCPSKAPKGELRTTSGTARASTKLTASGLIEVHNSRT